MRKSQLVRQMIFWRQDRVTGALERFETPRPLTLVPEFIVNSRTIVVGVSKDANDQHKAVSKFRRLHKWGLEIQSAQLRSAWIFNRTHPYEWVFTVKESSPPPDGAALSSLTQQEYRKHMLIEMRREMKMFYEKTGHKLARYDSRVFREYLREYP